MPGGRRAVDPTPGGPRPGLLRAGQCQPDRSRQVNEHDVGRCLGAVHLLVLNDPKAINFGPLSWVTASRTLRGMTRPGSAAATHRAKARKWSVTFHNGSPITAVHQAR
jgi:hypothetical protein